jgi:hypothetical protein
VVASECLSDHEINVPNNLIWDTTLRWSKQDE